MFKNKLILAAAAAMLIGAGCAQQPAAPARVPAPTPAPAPAAAPQAAAPTAPTVKALVNFTDKGFDPASVTLPRGAQVIWKNMTKSPMRVASNPHPVHTDYPGFDSNTLIPPGGEWNFTFTKAGTWGYHNHLNPSVLGTVVITP